MAEQLLDIGEVVLPRCADGDAMLLALDEVSERGRARLGIVELEERLE